MRIRGDRKGDLTMDSLMTYAQENSSSGSGFSTIWFIIGAIGLWKMFEKAGEPGWIGIIPFYRDYKLCEKVMNDPWYWLRELVVIIPIIGWIGALYFKYQIGKATAKAYGQPEAYAWGYTFIDAAFYCITGLSNTSYYGPFGAGDTRTGEARQAKTVDFDVVKNDPAQTAPNDAPAAEPVKETDEVEFTFDGSDE